LTAAAAIKATVLRGAPARASVRPFERPLAWVGIAAAAAAAIACAIVYRPSSTIPVPKTTPSVASATSTVNAVVNPIGIASQPVILTARLDVLAGRSTAAFRTDETRSRSPKNQGVIVSADDGEVAIDLGSLDGVVKGSELRVFRGDADTKAIGRLTIVTVFRERSRGRMAPGGSPRTGDRVEVAPGVRVAALSDQVGALIAAGDITAARALAERAVSVSQTPGVSADARRRALAQLGTLEHRAGVLDVAERHLRGAVDGLDTEPAATGMQRAEILNELGAVLIERGNHSEAESTLRRAQSSASGATGVYVANNLAALAALHRDTLAAESMYRSALALAGSSPELEADRRAILKNLDRLKAQR
jgi:Flp pilus assembly protein TadD